VKRIRTLTWNIHKGIGGLDRRYRLERVEAVISKADADIVLLQEVAQGVPRAGQDDQVELLQERLGYKHRAFGPEHRFRVGGYGNLILSRTPLSAVEHVDLRVDWRKKRGALVCKTVVHFVGPHGEPHERSIWIVNTHLGLAQSERARQLAQLMNASLWQHIHHDTPVVLAGDLNDFYATLGPRILEPSGFERAGKIHNTFPAFAPLRPLDAIFVRGSARVVRAGPPDVPLVRLASDHLPLVAEIEISSH
jgi:endonuclease/exonuclease/phosphatase family metal-dependent hydrolase